MMGVVEGWLFLASQITIVCVLHAAEEEKHLVMAQEDLSSHQSMGAGVGVDDGTLVF